MAVMSFLLLILIIGGVFIAGSFGVAYATNRNANDKEKVQQLRADLKTTLGESYTAIKALQSIANGAGNPILEASDALDRINNNDIKELN